MCLTATFHYCPTTFPGFTDEAVKKTVALAVMPGLCALEELNLLPLRRGRDTHIWEYEFLVMDDFHFVPLHYIELQAFDIQDRCRIFDCRVYEAFTDLQPTLVPMNGVHLPLNPSQTKEFEYMVLNFHLLLSHNVQTLHLNLV
ncbi:unnamed protein product [Cyclocybe aegerita]|uniref:Uncharacterized protein n=1 Tax=Cyclocybe aegerita TaxID=1973307 RepID=A0A8S0WUN3_CYCAE|nr:unnamed protein product [Cyclocybe aegerita]